MTGYGLVQVSFPTVASPPASVTLCRENVSDVYSGDHPLFWSEGIRVLPVAGRPKLAGFQRNKLHGCPPDSKRSRARKTGTQLVKKEIVEFLRIEVYGLLDPASR